MADFSTLGEIRAKLKRDLDLEQEEFVTPVELTGYINEAIDDAEAIIHGLYADYFLTKDTITLVSGTDSYAMPANIYANKIRRLMYDDGVSRYRLTRIKNFDLIPFLTAQSNQTDYLRYVLENNSAGAAGIVQRMYPTPQVNGTFITRWYIRNANRLVAESDICDIIEFVNYIYAHVKLSVARKEKLGQDMQIAMQHLAAEQKLMEETLYTLMPDEDNQVRKDLTYYHDFYLDDENFSNY
jgi:hypothetical protein